MKWLGLSAFLTPTGEKGHFTHISRGLDLVLICSLRVRSGCRGGEAAVHSGPLITGRFQGEEFVNEPAHDATGDSTGRGERSSAPFFTLTLLYAQFSWRFRVQRAGVCLESQADDAKTKRVKAYVKSVKSTIMKIFNPSRELLPSLGHRKATCLMSFSSFPLSLLLLLSSFPLWWSSKG